MSEYYLPYQFVPAKETINGEPPERLPWLLLANVSALQPCRHDLWLRATASGRFVCRVHLESPTLIGRKQEKTENQPTQVIPYERAGIAAIPANSLRGMFGSLAEMLSQSSLRVLAEQFRPFFPPGLRPWNSDRLDLTWAERLFGVVGPSVRPDHGSARNLASRLRFADALPVQPPSYVDNGQEQILSVLESPKPTNGDIPADVCRFMRQQGHPWPPHTPSTYFHGDAAGNTPVPRNKIAVGDYFPNGRKIYLTRASPVNSFQHTGTGKNAPNDRNLQGKLLDARQNFFFHVDFDNLPPEELALLTATLQPGLFQRLAGLSGNSQFRHRLGLGKPLGLGQVTVWIEALFLIDHRRRYDEKGGLYQKKYAWIQRPTGNTPSSEEWHKMPRYSGAECEALSADAAESRSGEPTAPWDLSEDKLKRIIDADTLGIALTLGDPCFLKRDTPIRKRGRRDGAEALRPVVPGNNLPPCGST